MDISSTPAPGAPMDISSAPAPGAPRTISSSMPVAFPTPVSAFEEPPRKPSVARGVASPLQHPTRVRRGPEPDSAGQRMRAGYFGGSCADPPGPRGPSGPTAPYTSRY